MTIRWISIALLGGAGLLASGCSGRGGSSGGDFVSDNPFGGGGQGGDTGAAGGDDDDSDEGGGDAEREIAEADIVHIDGDRLYALSQYGGLAVIDVSNPDDLRIMGRYRAHAVPFEMYIDDRQVFIMYTDFGHYGWDEEAGGYRWISSSQLVALDATDPADITPTGEFEMPGRIQDSRRVGDVLYLVTHEDGYCWSCEPDPNTAVTSLDVSNPADVQMVDQLRFVVDAEYEDWGWSGQRSVSATNERMYVAGMEFSGDWENGHSVIDVVDISDPGGVLTKGASVPVAGQITNRWQMDEYEDVLRVVSQPGVWGGEEPPVIETFSIASASDIQALGSTTMSLPRPEALRSVRFDGERGYAITFERVDPLFTLDLSDPADPQQVGELEIPGWVHHMEPRGDRVLGLGFDPDHPEGALNVSLFDVSDFAAPTLMSRVHFGGDWAYFGEDQNRIHKAFTVLDDIGLMLVPFSGWEWDNEDEYGCSGRYHSAIQLVDWADDTLVRRGQAEAHGTARRALIHRDRLLSMSDKSVEAFDIADRDAPTRTSEVALAKNVTRVGVGDGIVVRLSRDWWSDETLLEIVGIDDPDAPDPLGSLNLHEVLDGDDNVEGCWYWGLYDAELVVHGRYAYMFREVWDFETYSGSSLVLDVFDLTDATAPIHVGTQTIDASLGWGGYGIVGLDEMRIAKLGSAIVLSSTGGGWYGETEEQSARVYVLDLTDPADPQLRPSLPRPGALLHGNLQKFGDSLVSWHARAVDGDASKIRFFLDRVDVSDPSAPTMATPINVPGVVAGYDDATGRAITVDFRLEATQVDDEEECYQNPKIHDFDYDAGVCYLAHRTLNLVQLTGDTATLLGTVDVEGTEATLRSVASTDSRVFAQLSTGGAYGWGVVGVDEADGSGGSTVLPPSDTIAVMSDWTSGPLSIESTTEIGVGSWWIGVLRAIGDVAVFHADAGLGVFDSTDSGNPTVTIHDLVGWGCWDFELSGGLALCPMGEFGLQTIQVDG